MQVALLEASWYMNGVRCGWCMVHGQFARVDYVVHVTTKLGEAEIRLPYAPGPTPV